VKADVLVGSATDPGERVDAVALPQRPRVIVQTRGAGGGSWRAEDGSGGTWQPVAPPGPLRDSYGAGDCFHAVLTASLGGGATMPEALAAAAQAGAEAVTRRGPYGQ
jgi:sugar/nucleoside kinase (ribokinase family)